MNTEYQHLFDIVDCNALASTAEKDVISGSSWYSTGCHSSQPLSFGFTLVKEFAAYLTTRLFPMSRL